MAQDNPKNDNTSHSTTTTPPMAGRSAFFYGTLMAPAVLHRVCHNGTQPDNPIYATHNPTTSPAILHNFRRSKVLGADYPAIIPDSSSSVRGVYVTGLTDNDVWRLDLFEGDEYTREKVMVRILTTVGDEAGVGNVEAAEQVEAETYVWKPELVHRMDPAEWDFAEFQRDKMRFWIGPGSEHEYAEVDEAVARQQPLGHDGTGGRSMNGDIGQALSQAHQQQPLKPAV